MSIDAHEVPLVAEARDRFVKAAHEYADQLMGVQNAYNQHLGAGLRGLMDGWINKPYCRPEGPEAEYYDQGFHQGSNHLWP